MVGGAWSVGIGGGGGHRSGLVLMLIEAIHRCNGSTCCWMIIVLMLLSGPAGFAGWRAMQSWQPVVPTILSVTQTADGRLIEVTASPPGLASCVRTVDHVLMQGAMVPGTDRYEDGVKLITLSALTHVPGVGPKAAGLVVRGIIIPPIVPPGRYDYWIRSNQECWPAGLIRRDTAIGPYPITVP